MGLASVASKSNQFYDCYRSAVIHGCAYSGNQLYNEGEGYYFSSFNNYFIQPIEENSILMEKQTYFEILSEIFYLKNRDEIVRYLSYHEKLIYPLFYAYTYIKEVFVLESKPILEVVGDQEENFEGIFIIIKTNLAPEKSLDLLEKFDSAIKNKLDYDVTELIGVDFESAS
jgi:hypothetical protein